MYSVNEGGEGYPYILPKGMDEMCKEAKKHMEELEHNKKDGFYDKRCDMHFEDLDAWRRHHGYTWKELGC